MGTNTFIRDPDVGEFNQLDGRRVEVIADGLPLWHGAQLAIDTTLVSPLHGDGTARRGAANSRKVALHAAWRIKEATYPELSGEGGRARLVCGGGWWPLVSGGINLSQRLGEGTGSSGATHPSRKGPGRLPSSVEFPDQFGDEEDTESVDAFEESVEGDEEVPHSPTQLLRWQFPEAQS